MRVLADFHHGELFYSLQLLFENRLEWELYRPVGLEWYYEGYWKVFDHIDTARQFLDLGLGGTFEDLKNRYPDAFFLPLNDGAKELSPGTFVIPDVTKDIPHRGITLEEFKATKFDILISSIPQHIEPFNRLISKFQPGAKHVFQVGNAWSHPAGVKNILASTASFSVPAGVNICFYHQEFDLNSFSFEPPLSSEPKKIFSYIHWMREKDLFATYAMGLPDFYCRSFGGGMEDSIAKTVDVAKKMKSSTFTWHYKPEGDGFGHVIFTSYASGRPALIWGSHYKGKLASVLLSDGVTCIDMEKGTLDENISRIRYFSNPDEHQKMCQAAFNRFKSHVDFDAEEYKIRRFLENLI